MNRVVALLVFVAVLTADWAMAEPNQLASVLENNLLCLRVERLTDDFSERFQSLLPTNPVTGIILDLRFADGDATAADAVLKTFSGRKKSLVVLVNAQTRGGAAESARRLRADGLGLLIGGTNAVGIFSPDIAVVVATADEQKYFTNPFAMLTSTNANSSAEVKNQLAAFVDHTTEAELVRQRIKDGEDPGEDIATPRPAPAQPVIRDPVLARAVDFLKALAVLKPNRG